MTKAILAPAAVLVIWSLIVLVWMAVRRYSGVKEVPKETRRELPKVGGRGQDLDPVLPEKARWASHNYTHLVEQPTLFYAVVLILAVVGEGHGVNVALAWGYVIFRIAHSLWQLMVNTVPMRFALFLVSTACLIGLAVNALRATLA